MSGFLELQEGDCIFSRDPKGSGKGKDDVIQMWVTGPYVDALAHKE